jgi:hypothetical protein
VTTPHNNAIADSVGFLPHDKTFLRYATCLGIAPPTVRLHRQFLSPIVFSVLLIFTIPVERTSEQLHPPIDPNPPRRVISAIDWVTIVHCQRSYILAKAMSNAKQSFHICLRLSHLPIRYLIFFTFLNIVLE